MTVGSPPWVRSLPQDAKSTAVDNRRMSPMSPMSRAASGGGSAELVDGGAAGLMLTLAGGVCVIGRVGVGVLADRWSRGHLAIVGGMLVVGAAGSLLFTVDSLPVTVLGVVFGYGVAWAFPGLLTYSVVRLHPSAPAAATSVTRPVSSPVTAPAALLRAAGNARRLRHRLAGQFAGDGGGSGPHLHGRRGVASAAGAGACIP